MARHGTDFVAFNAQGGAYMIGYDRLDVALEMAAEVKAGRAVRIKLMTTEDACAAHLAWIRRLDAKASPPLSPDTEGGRADGR